MTSTAPVEIRQGSVCGKIGSLDEAAFTVNGAPAPEEVTATLRDAVATATSSIAEREICTSYLPEGDALMTQVRVDGVRHPELDMRVLWVEPSEGFLVHR
jgi:hypothetical protein